ncbi:unnamed protein product [Somion occarium]|uniref:DUF4187 domain-containing protein n=1 Tax=Somion occarium TaxID=3059160 RepID=A0ABP1D2Y7_9APHY
MFLFATAAATSSGPKTYSERRKEAEKLAALRNAQHRKKSRRQLELESREEGLRKSLFERAKEEEEAGSGQQNKALAMMMKMGFKPGQTLGPSDEVATKPDTSAAGPSYVLGKRRLSEPQEDEANGMATIASRHRAVPLPLSEWAGKKGIGLGKRAASPSATERLAKMAKMAEDRDHLDFRDRARQEYEERRAEGQLGPAQRTCVTLDEKDGREFNVLWLNPNNPDGFPEGFLDALNDPVLVASIHRNRVDTSLEGRLRARMQADALQPLTSTLDDVESRKDKVTLAKTTYSEEDIKEATQFLRLGPKDRLTLVLEYLRRRYAYCFWCGTEYNDQEDLENNCPGPDEEDHD